MTNMPGENTEVKHGSRKSKSLHRSRSKTKRPNIFSSRDRDVIKEGRSKIEKNTSKLNVNHRSSILLGNEKEQLKKIESKSSQLNASRSPRTVSPILIRLLKRSSDVSSRERDRSKDGTAKVDKNISRSSVNQRNHLILEKTQLLLKPESKTSQLHRSSSVRTVSPVFYKLVDKPSIYLSRERDVPRDDRTKLERKIPRTRINQRGCIALEKETEQVIKTESKTSPVRQSRSGRSVSPTVIKLTEKPSKYSSKDRALPKESKSKLDKRIPSSNVIQRTAVIVEKESQHLIKNDLKPSQHSRSNSKSKRPGSPVLIKLTQTFIRHEEHKSPQRRPRSRTKRSNTPRTGKIKTLITKGKNETLQNTWSGSKSKRPTSKTLEKAKKEVPPNNPSRSGPQRPNTAVPLIRRPSISHEENKSSNQNHFLALVKRPASSPIENLKKTLLYREGKIIIRSRDASKSKRPIIVTLNKDRQALISKDKKQTSEIKPKSTTKPAARVTSGRERKSSVEKDTKNVHQNKSKVIRYSALKDKELKSSNLQKDINISNQKRITSGFRPNSGIDQIKNEKICPKRSRSSSFNRRTNSTSGSVDKEQPKFKCVTNNISHLRFYPLFKTEASNVPVDVKSRGFHKPEYSRNEKPFRNSITCFAKSNSSNCISSNVHLSKRESSHTTSSIKNIRNLSAQKSSKSNGSKVVSRPSSEKNYVKHPTSRILSTPIIVKGEYIYTPTKSFPQDSLSWKKSDNIHKLSSIRHLDPEFIQSLLPGNARICSIKIMSPKESQRKSHKSAPPKKSKSRTKQVSKKSSSKEVQNNKASKVTTEIKNNEEKHTEKHTTDIGVNVNTMEEFILDLFDKMDDDKENEFLSVSEVLETPSSSGSGQRSLDYEIAEEEEEEDNDMFGADKRRRSFDVKANFLPPFPRLPVVAAEKRRGAYFNPLRPIGRTNNATIDIRGLAIYKEELPGPCCEANCDRRPFTVPLVPEDELTPLNCFPNRRCVTAGHSCKDVMSLSATESRNTAQQVGRGSSTASSSFNSSTGSASSWGTHLPRNLSLTDGHRLSPSRTHSSGFPFQCYNSRHRSLNAIQSLIPRSTGNLRTIPEKERKNTK